MGVYVHVCGTMRMCGSQCTGPWSPGHVVMSCRHAKSWGMCAKSPRTTSPSKVDTMVHTAAASVSTALFSALYAFSLGAIPTASAHRSASPGADGLIAPQFLWWHATMCISPAGTSTTRLDHVLRT